MLRSTLMRNSSPGRWCSTANEVIVKKVHQVSVHPSRVNKVYQQKSWRLKVALRSIPTA